MTLLDRTFEVAEELPGGYSADGTFVPGKLSVRAVRGTVQPVNGRETVPAAVLSRNTGTVKVYSSERLECRGEGRGRAFVRHGGDLYELADEAPNQCGLVPHWKYYACLVPASQIPESVVEARF